MRPYYEFDYLLPSLSANNMSYSTTMPYEAFSPLYRQYPPLSLSNYFQASAFPRVENFQGLIAPLPHPYMINPYSVTNFHFMPEPYPIDYSLFNFWNLKYAQNFPPQFYGLLMGASIKNHRLSTRNGDKK